MTRASGLMRGVPQSDWTLHLRYRVTLAKTLDSRRKFLDAAMRYYELSQAQHEALRQEELVNLLCKAVTCALLGNAGPQRSRILGLLYKDERVTNDMERSEESRGGVAISTRPPFRLTFAAVRRGRRLRSYAAEASLNLSQVRRARARPQADGDGPIGPEPGDRGVHRDAAPAPEGVARRRADHSGSGDDPAQPGGGVARVRSPRGASLDESRRRRGRDVDVPWRPRLRRGRAVETRPRPRRGRSVETAAATWTFRGDRGCDADVPWRRGRGRDADIRRENTRLRYVNVSVDSVAKLLDVDARRIETVASKMISSGRLAAKLDQVDGLLVFTDDPPPLVRFDEAIARLCLNVNACYEKAIEIQDAREAAAAKT